MVIKQIFVLLLLVNSGPTNCKKTTLIKENNFFKMYENNMDAKVGQL